MKKRHSDILISKLEKCVVTQGWCILTHEELRLWYGQKITKTVWRDLLDRIEGLLEENYDDLPERDRKFLVYQYDGSILIVDKAGTEKLADLATG